jgi:hypothetical protein
MARRNARTKDGEADAADHIAAADEQNLSFDPKTGRFVYTVKRGNAFGRAHAVATTTDFYAENWTDYGVVFGADDLDQTLGKQVIEQHMADPSVYHPFCAPGSRPRSSIDVYNLGAFKYESVYIGIATFYHAICTAPDHNTAGFDTLQLATSRNLVNWTRLGNRSTFLGPSRLDSGAYDLCQIMPPSNAVVSDGGRGDELFFFYTGAKNRWAWNHVRSTRASTISHV